DLEHVRRLGAVGGAVAEVLPSAPGAVGEVRRGGVLRLVGVPSGGAGGDQEVGAVPFEHGRGFAVVAVEGVQQFLDVEVVVGEPVYVQVVVLACRRDEVGGAVVVDEDGLVPRHVAQGPEGAPVGVVAVDGVGDGHGRFGVAVVRAVLLVRPHDVVVVLGVVDHLGAFDVRRVEVRV